MKENFHVSVQDSEFRTRFESGDLPAQEFGHREHLRLAYIYLVEGDVDTATDNMRASIKNFIVLNGVDPGKYHETITRAWILAVRHFMAGTPRAESSDHFVDQNPVMLDTGIMLTHYSAELLFSDGARNEFTDPDLDPIPLYDGETDP